MVLEGCPVKLGDRPLSRGSASASAHCMGKHAYDSRQHLADVVWYREGTPDEDIIRLAGDCRESGCAEVKSGADHVVETHEVSSPL